MTLPISKSLPFLAVAAAAVVATGCASIQSKLPGSSQSQTAAAADPAAKPAPVNLCADATDPAPAKKGANATPLSYGQVTKLMGQKSERQVKKSLVGKTIQVCVTRSENENDPGTKNFEVKAGDQTYFTCRSSAPDFKGGQITAKITNYFFNPEMNSIFVEVDRCVATNAAALAAPPAASTQATSAASGKTAAPAPLVGGPAKPGMDARGNVIDPTKVESGSGRKVKGLRDWEGEITGNPVQGSKFDSLQIGMSLKQVTDIVGEPTDSGAYVTGKAFIPFFFGSDAARMELTYKGKGRLIFASGGVMGGTTGGNLIWVINSANEPGYR